MALLPSSVALEQERTCNTRETEAREERYKWEENIQTNKRNNNNNNNKKKQTCTRPSWNYTHAHTHTHTHARTHARTRTLACTHARTQIKKWWAGRDERRKEERERVNDP